MRLLFAIPLLIVFAASFYYQRISVKITQQNTPKIDIKFDSGPKLSAFPIPIENPVPAPPISARSAVVIDAKTGIVLFEKEPNLRHLPASTTKLMTALVSLERCTAQTSVKVGDFPKEGTLMGLEKGDVVSVETLLSGMLIASGNDAAYTLGQVCSSSLPQFIASMNYKAKELGMNNTRFENPAGYDNSAQYSTAKDLARLAKVAVANPLIAKIVSTKSTVLTDVSGNKTYFVENINELLGQVEGIEGVKTGQTEGSLEILLSKTTRDSHTIIISVLGSKDRFAESKGLIEWTFQNHTWQKAQ